MVSDFYMHADKSIKPPVIEACHIYDRLLLHFKEAKLSNRLQDNLISSGLLIEKFLHTINQSESHSQRLSMIAYMSHFFQQFFEVLLTKVGINMIYLCYE